jgi:hypothetical protein
MRFTTQIAFRRFIPCSILAGGEIKRMARYLDIPRPDTIACTIARNDVTQKGEAKRQTATPLTE